MWPFATYGAVVKLMQCHFELSNNNSCCRLQYIPFHAVAPLLCSPRNSRLNYEYFHKRMLLTLTTTKIRQKFLLQSSSRACCLRDVREASEKKSRVVKWSWIGLARSLSLSRICDSLLPHIVSVHMIARAISRPHNLNILITRNYCCCYSIALLKTLTIWKAAVALWRRSIKPNPKQQTSFTHKNPLSHPSVV